MNQSLTGRQTTRWKAVMTYSVGADELLLPDWGFYLTLEFYMLGAEMADAVGLGNGREWFRLGGYNRRCGVLTLCFVVLSLIGRPITAL